jgi:hypothetical protein
MEEMAFRGEEEGVFVPLLPLPPLLLGTLWPLPWHAGVLLRSAVRIGDDMALMPAHSREVESDVLPSTSGLECPEAWPASTAVVWPPRQRILLRLADTTKILYTLRDYGGMSAYSVRYPTCSP